MDPGCSCPDKGTPGGMCRATPVTPFRVSPSPLLRRLWPRFFKFRGHAGRRNGCGSVLLVRIYVVEGFYALALFSA